MAGKKVGKDSGYIFTEPLVERKRKTVKPGQTLIDGHRSGTIVADNKDEPLVQSDVLLPREHPAG